MTVLNKIMTDDESNATFPVKRDGKSFDDLYRIQERLQTGSYGIVYRVTSTRQPEKEFAAKIVKRKGLADKIQQDIQCEVHMMRTLLDVESVTKLVDYFVTDQWFILVQTLAKGGDLFERINQKSLYSEHEARTTAVKLLQILRVLHERNTVHRDIKPENILLMDSSDVTSILLADFGFATYMPKEGYLTRRCGTPAYIAPEVWNSAPYDYACDMWSVGVLLWVLIDGFPPFEGRDNKEIRERTCIGRAKFSSPRWDNVSANAKELILGLLTVDPKQRLTVEQALQSKWIQSGLTDALFENLDWQPSDLALSCAYSL